MEDKIFEFLNLSQKEIEETINNFIMNNNNEDGIDLSKVYLANLAFCYPKTNLSPYVPNGYQGFFGINCPINKTNDYNKVTIVFILKSQSKSDHIFIDMFNKTILQSTYVNINGLLSFMPEIREGVTVSEYFSLKDILGIDRMSYQDISKIYNAITKYNKEDIMNLISNGEIGQLLSDISNKKNR